MKVRVVYLGPARAWAGADGDAMELAGPLRLAQLVERLVALRPGLGAALDTLRFAVNEEFVGPDTELSDGDEVAVIPPVSGGADDLLEIVQGPIDAAAVRSHVVGDPAWGGIVVFEGVTRFERNGDHRGLVKLEYEAYEGMAIKEMQKLAAAARARWPVGRLAMVHRTGEVPCGEPSVIIAVACGHRAEAFEVCRWLIDTLKREVPIWKREIWEDGSATWVDPSKDEPA